MLANHDATIFVIMNSWYWIIGPPDLHEDAHILYCKFDLKMTCALHHQLDFRHIWLHFSLTQLATWETFSLISARLVDCIIVLELTNSDKKNLPFECSSGPCEKLEFIGSHIEPSLADVVNPSDVNQLTISRGGARTLVGRAAARVQLGSSHVSLCSI